MNETIQIRRIQCFSHASRPYPRIAHHVLIHNIAKMLDEEDFEGDDDVEFECDPVDPTQDASDGKVVRDHIANTFILSRTDYSSSREKSVEYILQCILFTAAHPGSMGALAH